MRTRGFTLIELMVVISIIGVLSTVVLSSLSTARVKAYDARRISDLHSIYTAYAIHNTSGGSQLANPGCGGGCQISDDDPRFLQELIAENDLASIPHPPDNAAANPYMYYDYGPGNSYGFMIVTQLEGRAPQTTPYPGSCRPWHAANNWCEDDISSTFYCLCYTY
jgi:prepilin-type N-terminal cleavage/methylation domain-containing protein